MSKLFGFLLQLLAQFAGGPGLMENNLVRFILPAILWGALLIVALIRQRDQDLPREKLLVWGFGLGAASAVLMTGFVALQMMDVIERETTYPYLVPVDRALAMASILVVAGAFLRYILDDARLARRYLVVGGGVTGLCLLLAVWSWPRSLATLTEANFHTTWAAWLFEVALSILIIIAIVLLRRKVNWLSRVVTIALAFFLSSEFLAMLNYATDKTFNHVICPIGNSLRMLAIPLLGYVYLREQAIDKKQAEAALEAYRQHLEELVEARTADLTTQNNVAAILSRSLELETILDTALDEVLSVVEMDIGLVFLQDSASQDLSLRSCRGSILQDEIVASRRNWCCCTAISRDAMRAMRAITQDSTAYPCTDPDSNIYRQGLKMLVSVPLVSSNKAVGALTLGSRHAGSIAPDALELLTAIGQQIGMATENARLYQEAERTARELSLLHQMSIVLTSTLSSPGIYDQIAEQSVKLLNCQMACVLTWNEDTQRVVWVAGYGMGEAESGAMQALTDTPERLHDLVTLQQCVAIDDAQNDPRVPQAWLDRLNVRALLGVPIRGMEASLGTLYLIDCVGARHWRSEELQLVESFVNRAAVALMNAQLCSQLEWTAALEERQRIAADMHDGLAQTVSLLGLQIEEVIELIQSSSPRQAVAELSRMRDVVEQASLDVRRSIASLQGEPQPRRSIQDLLSELPAQLPVGDGPDIQLIYHVEEPLFLPLEQRAQALLIAQELLVNAYRHASAKEIKLTLESGERETRITVADDGIGFDPAAWWENSQDHFGLGIIHARAARIGARLEIDSAPGQGTRVSLSLPAPAGASRIQVGASRQCVARQTTVTYETMT